MSLPSSGIISMSQVAAELGISASGLSLNDGRVRALSGLTASISSGNNFNALHAKTRFVITAGQLTTSTASSPGVGVVDLAYYGYSTGLIFPPMGAKTPITDTRYANFELWETGGGVLLIMGGTVPRGLFSYLHIFGIGHYDSSRASYYSYGNYTRWAWPVQNTSLVNGGVYSVYIN